MDLASLNWAWKLEAFWQARSLPIYKCMVEACALNMQGKDDLLIRKAAALIFHRLWHQEEDLANRI